MDKERRKIVLFKNFKESWRLKNFLVFLVFLCVAAFFWFLVSVDYNSNADFKETVRNILVGEDPEQVDSVPFRENLVEPDEEEVW